MSEQLLPEFQYRYSIFIIHQATKPVHHVPFSSVLNALTDPGAFSVNLVTSSTPLKTSACLVTSLVPPAMSVPHPAHPAPPANCTSTTPTPKTAVFVTTT